MYEFKQHPTLPQVKCDARSFFILFEEQVNKTLFLLYRDKEEICSEIKS